MTTHSKLGRDIILRQWYLILLGILLLGCNDSHKRSLSFQVINNYSSKINIIYQESGNPFDNSVTITKYAHPGESRIIHSYSASSQYYGADWFTYYWMYIEAITNSSGDTINFDPNVAHEWQFVDQDPDSYYNLTIDSTSFN